jgi:hypothetical protein
MQYTQAAAFRWSGSSTEVFMERVVVEREYEKPMSDEDLAASKRRAGPCFELRRVTHLGMYLSKDRRRAICVYDAPDAASVREAHEQENIPYARIWSTTEGPVGEPF